MAGDNPKVRTAESVVYPDTEGIVRAVDDGGEFAADTDAGVVIESAVSALPAGGGTIRLAAGEYSYAPPIEITRDNVTIRGAGYWGWDGFTYGNPGTGDEGAGKTKLAPSGPGDGIRVSGADGRTKGIELRDLYLYGRDERGVGVLVDDFSDQPVLAQLFVHNFDVGLDLDTDTCHVDRCTVMDVGGAGIRTRGYQGFVTDCTVYDVGGAGVVAGAEHSQVVANQVGRTAEGVVLSADVETTHGPADPGANAVVLGNVVRDTRSHGIRLSGAQSSVVGCNQVVSQGAGSRRARLLRVEGGRSGGTASHNCCIGNVLRYDGSGTAPDYAVELGADTEANRIDGTVVPASATAFGSGVYRDDGVANLLNGVGANGQNDPATAGAWAGAGREGAVVKWDDESGSDYLSVYRDGSWWRWEVD